MLIVYLSDDPETLIKENMISLVASAFHKFALWKQRECFCRFVFWLKIHFFLFWEQPLGNAPGPEPTDKLENVGLIIESVEVLHDLGNIAIPVAILFGLIYSLVLSYSWATWVQTRNCKKTEEHWKTVKCNFEMELQNTWNKGFCPQPSTELECFWSRHWATNGLWKLCLNMF